MPCFHGLAVSIHTTGASGGPLSEHSIQKQTKFHRITSYIPVPTPKLQPGTTKPEPATFAISITLLTPGLSVPYSTPNATSNDPHPRPKVVGGSTEEFGHLRGQHGVITPYKALTTSPNETIAAYIYFDGRAKEEVATLLRKGEETWVNSRWVSVPESEGGGLAEKEFVFREVGLERWLNGLDLEGKEAAAKIERRRQRFEKKRRIKREKESDDEDDLPGANRKPLNRNGVLRYGDNKDAPVESLSADESLDSFEGDDSEDDAPMPESAGQIKVALFRVLASGEVKRGEYSPQFDVHDDEDQMNSGDGDAEIDHTTSFAKPKTLDPKSISTQTVTGIDPPDKPYAVFTFLYRGQRQLQKMGIFPSAQPVKTAVAVKRKSTQIDFGSLAPLNTNAPGTKGFTGYREPAGPSSIAPKNSQTRTVDAMDSDAEDEDDGDKPLREEADDSQDPIKFLSPEEVLQEEKLSEDVRKIKLKRQHSAEPLSAPSPKEQDRKASPPATTPTFSDVPIPSIFSNGNQGESSTSQSPIASALPLDLTSDPAAIGSPFKKQRSSLPGFDAGVRKTLALDAIASATPRRGSGDSGVSSAFPNAGGTSWPTGLPEPVATKFQAGSVVKTDPEHKMEEEL